MKNSRRQFMILSAAGACTLALNGKVQAQAMVAELTHKLLHWVTKQMQLQLIKLSMQNMLLVKSAITALYSKVKQAMRLAVALCLAPRKLLAKAGALLTLRRLN